MPAIHHALYDVLRTQSRDMSDGELQIYVGGILCGLAMAAREPARCAAAHEALRQEWALDPSTPSAEYAPDGAALPLLRMLARQRELDGGAGGTMGLVLP